MELNQLINEINELADEQENPSAVVNFINGAIAKINIDCGANFPSMSLEKGTDEPVFPEKWQRSLLIPFAVGRIKQIDSSQFEYSDSYSEFLVNLMEFKAKYTIPDEYKDGDTISGDLLSSPSWNYGGW